MAQDRGEPIYGLVGEHLGHSHSPLVHGLLGSAPYKLLEVGPEELRGFVRRMEYRGINVTIPYKRDVLALADEASPVARRLGNANTLVVRGEGASARTLYADNTDYFGFEYLLDRVGAEVRGSTCLVMGDGGAAATVRMVLTDRGAREVVNVSRRGDVTYGSLDGENAWLFDRTDILVNATPVGMYPHGDDAPLLDPRRFKRLGCVLDLVYNPLRTNLVLRAREAGIPACGGLPMLVAQAKRSSDLFLGDGSRDDAVIGDVLDTVRKTLESIALIGMPGCGKTTTGRELARMLGRRFIDVDELVVERTGRSIPDLFADCSEARFRDVETACLGYACSIPGCVVSCGGGVVERPENLAILRSNCSVVLLTRGLDAVGAGCSLATGGRPLSQALGVDLLRERRAHLYHAWADVEVAPDDAGARATAAGVAARLGYTVASLADRDAGMGED